MSLHRAVALAIVMSSLALFQLPGSPEKSLPWTQLVQDLQGRFIANPLFRRPLPKSAAQTDTETKLSCRFKESRLITKSSCPRRHMLAAEASFPWNGGETESFDPDVVAAIEYTATQTGADLSRFRKAQRTELQRMVRLLIW